MWQVAIEIALRAGGDPGRAGMIGSLNPPVSQKPERVIVIETEGWAILDEASKSGFEILLQNLERAGVVVLRRKQHPAIEVLENVIGTATAICDAITRWENRWSHRNLINQNPDCVSERAKATLALAEAMTPDDYRASMLARETAQLCHSDLTPLADAVITVACPGPAPLWLGGYAGPTTGRPPNRRCRV